MGKGEEDQVEPVQFGDRGGRVHEGRIGGGQRRGVPGHVLADMVTGGGHRQLEVWVGSTQPEQLDAGVPRRTDHSDLHRCSPMTAFRGSCLQVYAH